MSHNTVCVLHKARRQKFKIKSGVIAFIYAAVSLLAVETIWRSNKKTATTLSQEGNRQFSHLHKVATISTVFNSPFFQVSDNLFIFNVLFSISVFELQLIALCEIHNRKKNAECRKSLIWMYFIV